jgi:hypothetical protein
MSTLFGVTLPTTTLAYRLRETALWVPRAQARELLDLAFEAARLEETMNNIVEEAQADAVALAWAKASGHG